jgi:hypothetical protein
MSTIDRWVGTKEAASVSGYTPIYIRYLIRQNRVEARRVGNAWLVNLDSLLAHKAKMESLGKLKHNPWRKDLQTGGQGGEQDAE